MTYFPRRWTSRMVRSLIRLLKAVGEGRATWRGQRSVTDLTTCFGRGGAPSRPSRSHREIVSTSGSSGISRAHYTCWVGGGKRHKDAGPGWGPYSFVTCRLAACSPSPNGHGGVCPFGKWAVRQYTKLPMRHADRHAGGPRAGGLDRGRLSCRNQGADLIQLRRADPRDVEQIIDRRVGSVSRSVRDDGL